MEFSKICGDDMTEHRNHDDVSTWYSDELLQQGGATVAEFATDEEAELCSFRLEDARIQNVILRRRSKLDLRAPQVLVAPDDIQAALEVLKEPIKDGVRRDYLASRSMEDFQIPACVSCLSRDVILVTNSPVNHWKCDTCDARWTEGT